jgi:acetyltransferase-like isoleucine patch superfamily enzyme
MLTFFKRYGFYGSIRLCKSYIYTRVFFPDARLIRLPFDIRNRKNITIGKNFTSGFGCRIEAFPMKSKDITCISIGNDVQINDYVHIAAAESIKIGNNVLMASKIFITDISHGSYGVNGVHDSPTTIPKERSLTVKPVEIGDNVWIGEFVSILPGVTIGKGSVIGTMSVVSKSIPPNCIAVGSPAKVIKQYDFESKMWVKV